MGMIRRADAAALARDAVVLDLGDLARQGEAILERAQARAEGIVADAQAQRERLISGAREAGHQEGLAAGRAEGLHIGREAGRAEAVEAMREQVEAAMAAWQAALDAFEAQRRAILGEARQDVLRFACTMGQRVAKRTVELDPAVVADQLEAALELVMRPTRVRVRVAASGADVLRDAMPRLADRLGQSADFDIVVDEALSDGSVRVEADGTRIDATIETQVARIVDALLPTRPAEDQAGAEP